MDKVKSSTGESGFQVDCEAGGAGRFCVNASSVWIKVGQRVRRHGTHEMWDSIAVEGQQEQDGTLVVRVIVFNPEWDEPLQIASLRSRPQDLDSLSALGCNLNHIAV
jgi:hypothetical protein